MVSSTLCFTFSLFGLNVGIVLFVRLLPYLEMPFVSRLFHKVLLEAKEGAGGERPIAAAAALRSEQSVLLRRLLLSVFPLSALAKLVLSLFDLISRLHVLLSLLAYRLLLSFVPHMLAYVSFVRVIGLQRGSLGLLRATVLWSM